MADPTAGLYSDKPQGYFARARTEITPLIPRVSKSGQLRVLEIGCSEGHTLAWLKNQGLCTWVAGVEPISELGVPTGVIDQFDRMDIEKGLPDIPPQSIDLILCLDVLEHLIDPWKTIQRLDTLLKSGGTWIISVPNIRNYRVLIDLAIRGRFQYSDAGILDKSHLRFFTRRSAIDLLECSGSHVTTVLNAKPVRGLQRVLCKIGLNDLIAKQFLLSADKP